MRTASDIRWEIARTASDIRREIAKLEKELAAVERSVMRTNMDGNNALSKMAVQGDRDGKAADALMNFFEEKGWTIDSVVVKLHTDELHGISFKYERYTSPLYDGDPTS